MRHAFRKNHSEWKVQIKPIGIFITIIKKLSLIDRQIKIFRIVINLKLEGSPGERNFE